MLLLDTSFMIDIDLYLNCTIFLGAYQQNINSSCSNVKLNKKGIPHGNHLRKCEECASYYSKPKGECFCMLNKL